MPADDTTGNTIGIIAAARQRRELTRAKAIRALRELDHAGTPITFAAVAQQGGVSTSWLYTQSDIRQQIERLRDATRRAPSPPIPAHRAPQTPRCHAAWKLPTNRSANSAQNATSSDDSWPKH